MFCKNIVLIGFSILLQTSAFQVSDIELTKKLPCNFLDTINITDGTYFPNKSIVFNGVVYPKERYAKVNFVDLPTHQMMMVNPHIRGCLCEIKHCIRFCCPEGSFLELNGESGMCSQKNITTKMNNIDIIDQNNDKMSVVIQEYFGLVHNFPCKKVVLPMQKFQITHEGKVRLPDTYVFNHHNYCIMNKNSIDANLAVCYEDETENEAELNQETGSEEEIILPICMLTSVLFIIATLVVYGSIPEIRHMNEKCLMCYLGVLAVAFTLLSFSQLNNTEFLHPALCQCLGYTLHFSFLSAFSWLNVINYDLWLSFQSSSKFKQLNEKMQLIWYIAYGYGLPGSWTLGTFIIDKIESIPDTIRPGMGINGCFPLNGLVQELLFFYLPASILLISNIVLFVLTAKRIHQVQIEANKNPDATLQGNATRVQKILNKKKDIFMLYFRLFIVAGVSWITEFIWFVVPFNGTIYFLADLFNSLQGVFIFILFVLKRRVIRLIKKKWNASRGLPNPTESGLSQSNEAEDYLRLNP